MVLKEQTLRRNKKYVITLFFIVFFLYCCIDSSENVKEMNDSNKKRLVYPNARKYNLDEINTDTTKDDLIKIFGEFEYQKMRQEIDSLSYITNSDNIIIGSRIKDSIDSTENE